MRNLWSPASFRGGRKKRDYFEGWHFKHSGGIDEGVEFDLSDGTSRISGAIAYGHLEVDGGSVSISDGRGYIEKDWGRSMLESWIWTQSNDSPAQGDSVMLSVAKIPWLGSAFRGFLCVFSHEGDKHLFTTYNGSRIEALSVTDERVDCSISRGGAKVRGGILRAPVAGLEIAGDLLSMRPGKRAERERT